MRGRLGQLAWALAGLNWKLGLPAEKTKGTRESSVLAVTRVISSGHSKKFAWAPGPLAGLIRTFAGIGVGARGSMQEHAGMHWKLAEMNGEISHSRRSY